jgi:YegS/Rv2252/BmrU family lipid kinase
VTTLLLVNPAAGHGRGRRLADEAAAAIQRHWGAPLRLETTAAGDAVEMVRGMDRGIERVIVLGGDGTLHEAVNGLLRRPEADRPPLGIVPAGTGNDYARMIGTRALRPSVAIDRLARGTVHRHDAGQAWDEYFINSVGIGFDAAVAARVQQTTWGRGLPAYIAAVARVIPEFKAFAATVRVDDEEFADRFLLIEVAIGYSVGGGFRLTPRAKLDDGRFDLCAIRHLPVPAILAKLPLAIVGWHTSQPEVRMRQGQRVTVSPTAGQLLVQLDGEVRRRAGPIEIRLLPGALAVLTTHP